MKLTLAGTKQNVDNSSTSSSSRMRITTIVSPKEHTKPLKDTR
ncbi:hypothetical protein RDI58_021137 [Solanum bulbocastanum]|uniref:Uncharacterized protein n=1 Tax=Solanum bulbocastanum TaxID=147425 RepID=A0AAN8Y8A9_SOLBU